MADVRPIAAVLAFLASLGIGFSAYLDWLDDRAPRDIPIRRLIDDVGGTAPSYWRSLALPIAIASVVGVLGVLLRSRGLLAVAFLGAAGTFGWWLLREADLRDDLEVGDFQVGVWVLLGSLVVLLLSGIALRRFTRRVDTTEPVGPDSPLDTSAAS